MRLAQAALCLIGYLAEGQIDGLLCDDTSTALQEYNATFGPFEAEIKGSMADSVLLAELLSKVVSVRNKLHAMGDPVGCMGTLLRPTVLRLTL